MRTPPSPKAFTLVELLVVIGIIALLISILLPSLNRARQQANLVNCQSNLRGIGQLVAIYAAENKGFGPLLWNETYYTTIADTLTITSTKRTAKTPFPNQPAGAELFTAEKTLGIFRDQDVPEAPWYDRATAYVGNIRAFGAQGIWSPDPGNVWKQRQMSGIRRAPEVMILWDGACDVGTGVNYGVYKTFPNGLDNYGMFGGSNSHGLLYPAAGGIFATNPALYDNPISLGAALGIGGTPSSAIPNSVTKSYLKAANQDYYKSGSFSGPGGHDVNYMRFRHVNNTTANFLFADFHVEPRKLGEVRARDICMNK